MFLRRSAPSSVRDVKQRTRRIFASAVERPCGVRCVLSERRPQVLVLDVPGSGVGAAKVRREADGNGRTSPGRHAPCRVRPPRDALRLGTRRAHVARLVAARSLDASGAVRADGAPPISPSGGARYATGHAEPHLPGGGPNTEAVAVPANKRRPPGSRNGRPPVTRDELIRHRKEGRVRDRRAVVADGDER